MKKNVTVYDLIQKLTQFPADKYVEFYTWVGHEQIKKYEKGWERDDYVRFEADEIDFEFDVGWNNSKTAIIIEMEANMLEDAERKEE